MTDTVSASHYPVLIVGAGPGGLSVAVALKDLGLTECAVIEKGVVGQAWLDYPADTHLLSESAPSHDDNMIGHVPTSEVFPHIPHPSHTLYQKYLQYVVDQKQIPVISNTEVIKVRYDSMHHHFILETRSNTELTAQYVVWAGGMFTTPNENMDCAGCFIHYAHMPYLPELDDDEVTVVGSANGASGVIMQLARPGRLITLITSKPYTVPEPIDCLWKEQAQFIKDLEKQGLVKIVENFRVKRIFEEDNEFIVESEDQQVIKVKHRPIVCTGFLPNIGPIKELVSEVCQGHETYIALDKAHQSEKQPNLYVAGAIGKLSPEQGFIVQFREFGQLIAEDIARKLHS